MFPIGQFFFNDSFKSIDMGIKESDKQCRELTVKGSEFNFEKLKKLFYSKLILFNTVISDELLDTLDELKIKDLTLIECSMEEEEAEFLITIGKVVFQKCIVVDKQNNTPPDTKTLENVGFIKIEDEIAIYNPDLIKLAGENSRLSEELLERLDAPDRDFQIEKDNKKILLEQIDNARKFVHLAKDHIKDLGIILDDPMQQKKILDFEATINPSLNGFQAIKQRILKSVDIVEQLVDRSNASSYDSKLMLELLLKENLRLGQTLKDAEKLVKNYRIFNKYFISPSRARQA